MEIINEMRPYRSASGSLKLEKKTADLIEKYILALSVLADKRGNQIENLVAYIKQGSGDPS